MKRFVILVTILSLGGCANYQASLNTFTNNVVATNNAIAQISASLAKNCNNLQATAQSLAALGSVFNVSSKARGGLAAANAALATWCIAPPSDIPTAIAVTAQEIANAKAAYQAAKNGQ